MEKAEALERHGVRKTLILAEGIAKAEMSGK
jgi:hypothetical protein